MRPRIVVSGVNLVECGPLSVFRDALSELATSWSEEYEFVALVHDRTLFDIPGITWMEFPAVKRSWLRRLRFEYWTCRTLAHDLKPHLWLAMHDMTPNVGTVPQAVYCHNPAPFYRMTLRQKLRDPILALFVLLYERIYRHNILRNRTVIVQQSWLREEFRRRYKTPHVIVAHPSIPPTAIPAENAQVRAVKRFLYPVYPRSFKNIELLLEAAAQLEERGCTAFELWLTCDGSENSYAHTLRQRYSELRCVRWLGLLPRDEVTSLYAEADCLLFASKLETWGMPISEFRATGKPMLLVDLPYAHETCGRYDRVHFFSPHNATALASILESIVHDVFVFGHSTPAPIAAPFAEDWSALFRLLLDDPKLLSSRDPQAGTPRAEAPARTALPCTQTMISHERP